MRALAIAAVIAMSSPASGQPGLSPPKPDGHSKQRSAALALTVLGTLAPAGLKLAFEDTVEPATMWRIAGVSAILLPSAGHWYAGRFLTVGLGIRFVGLTLASAFPDSEDRVPRFALVMLACGTGVIADLATVSDAVDAWNRRHAPTLAPMKVGDGYGVAIGGQW